MEFDVDSWREELESYRAEKDDQFAASRQSPLSPDEREAFDGLEYFEPDPNYRVAATVELLDDGETVTMETSMDGEQLYYRAASLHFEVPDADGKPVETSLVAYQRVDHDGGSLFVPFRDKTTGQQTYPGGRYMELEPDGDLTDCDRVTVDFNLAYAPFCAYSETFACPLPPEENWLDVAVEAGERVPR